MNALKRQRALFAMAVVAMASLAASARAATVAPLDLSAYRGKVVLVDFWASWCGPCKESFPWMQSLHERYAAQGLVVVGVNVDHDLQSARRFLDATRPTFAIVYDAQAALAERFQVSAMPSSFLIGRDGAVRYRHDGFQSRQRDGAEQELRALLAEPARDDQAARAAAATGS
jgi:cytochrome c biogenesis protein CcmG, thiol:disulfide interchange protein DsbE